MNKSRKISYNTRGLGHDDLSRYFGLSYATWLTLPRVLMEQMPDEWQGKMAALLNEYQETFPNQPDLGTQVRCTDLDNRLVKTPQWLINYRHPNLEEINKLRGKEE